MDFDLTSSRDGDILVVAFTGQSSEKNAHAMTKRYFEIVLGSGMKKVLADIQSGRFTRDWMLENKVNQTSFKATRAKLAEHPIEQVGAKLREMMPWIKQRALVDKSKN